MNFMKRIEELEVTKEDGGKMREWENIIVQYIELDHLWI